MQPGSGAQVVHDDLLLRMMQHFEKAISSQNVILAKMQDTMDKMAQDVNEMKESNRSSSTSGLRILCPMGCGSDFKKVQGWCRVPFVADRMQVTYVLDHLYRSCKLSRRQSASANPDCLFDPKDANHVALWMTVFPKNAELSAENVRHLIFSKVFNSRIHRNVSFARNWLSELQLCVTLQNFRR
jgi:hypothetical protein